MTEPTPLQAEEDRRARRAARRAAAQRRTGLDPIGEPRPTTPPTEEDPMPEPTDTTDADVLGVTPEDEVAALVGRLREPDGTATDIEDDESGTVDVVVHFRGPWGAARFEVSTNPDAPRPPATVSDAVGTLVAVALLSGGQP